MVFFFAAGLLAVVDFPAFDFAGVVAFRAVAFEPPDAFFAPDRAEAEDRPLLDLAPPDVFFAVLFLAVERPPEALALELVLLLLPVAFLAEPVLLLVPEAFLAPPVVPFAPPVVFFAAPVAFFAPPVFLAAPPVDFFAPPDAFFAPDEALLDPALDRDADAFEVDDDLDLDAEVFDDVLFLDDEVFEGVFLVVAINLSSQVQKKF